MFTKTKIKEPYKKLIIENNKMKASLQIAKIDSNKHNTHLIKKNQLSYKSVVVSSTQYCGYGGAATNAYNIIKYLRRNNINCVGVFFNNDLNVNYNPENLDGIFIYKESDNIDVIKKEVTNFLKSSPTVCIAKNYVAPLLCKQIFNCYTIYLVSGISYFLKNDNLTAQQLLSSNYKINYNLVNKREVNTIKNIDLIICNSNLTRNIFNKIYGKNKLYDGYIDTSTDVLSNHNTIVNNVDTSTDVLSNHNTIVNNDDNKIYDIIICCSNFKRTQKNTELMKKILKSEKLKKLKKIVIGSNYDSLLDLHNTEYKGLLSNTETINYIKKSKVILITSYFDSNPSTVTEAIFHNCVPIISNNIGHYECYPSELVCNTFNEDEWVNSTLNILNNLEKYHNIQIKQNSTSLLKFI